jgi:hypothetical protein
MTPTPTENETELREKLDNIAAEESIYDFDQIIDKIIALITSDKQRLLKGLMEDITSLSKQINKAAMVAIKEHRYDRDQEREVRAKIRAFDEANSVIQNKLEGLS